MESSKLIYKNNAFTLVELSIVIVVVGLIITSVTAGRSLVKAARLQGQVQQLQEYDTAFNTFRGAYGYSPGDLPNAASYWSSTTSGNGNGIINDDLGTTMGCMNDEAAGGATGRFAGEKLKFFQHLSLAGLIKERYDGTSIYPGGYPTLSYSNKYGIVAGSYWRPNGSTMGMAAPNNKFSTVGPYVYLGLGVSQRNDGALSMNWYFANDVFIPKDIYFIDTKIDDGLYSSGKLLGFSANYANCISSGNYNVASSADYCAAVYRLK